MFLLHRICVFLCIFICICLSELHSDEYELYGIVRCETEQKERSNISKILLRNGMELLLMSDVRQEDTVCALSVAAGSWDDPVSFPGMAHFVEHALFLGTETYPQEGEFMRYIQEHGGNGNAHTSRTSTTYGFSIATTAFEEALDRFSGFFIDPLFSPETIEREISSVHHEFEDKKENDFFRVWRVFKETSNTQHPNFNFSCGNLVSLCQPNRDNIKKWFDKYYVPSHMKVVIASSMSLSQLIPLAARAFIKVPCRIPYERSACQETVMAEHQRGKLYYVQSSFHGKMLTMMWEIPCIHMDTDMSCFFPYIEKALHAACVKHVGMHIENQGLAHQIQVEVSHLGQGYALLKMHVFLTEQGIVMPYKVIGECLRGLSYVKTIPWHTQVIERKYMKAREKIDSFHRAMDCAAQLLTGSIFVSTGHLDDRLIGLYLDHLLTGVTPKLGSYFLVAPTEWLMKYTTHVERWVGAKYYERVIDDKTLQTWEHMVPHEKEVAAEEQERRVEVEEDECVMQMDAIPVFLVHTPAAKIRLVQSRARHRVAEVFFFIDSPLMGGDVMHLACSELYVRFMNEKIKRMIADTNVRCDLEVDGGKLCVFITAPVDRVHQCLSTVLVIMKESVPSLEEFQHMQHRYSMEYEGDPEPLEYAQKVLYALVDRFQYTSMHVYYAVRDLSYEVYQQWCNRIFRVLSIEGAFLGDLSLEHAHCLWDQVRAVFEPSPYKSCDGLFFKCRYLQDKQSYCILQETHRASNALIFMLGSRGAFGQNSIVRQILSAFLQGEFFMQLRTKQQTAYKLYHWTKVVHGVMCYGFSLQSSSYTPLELLQKVEAFLENLLFELPERFTKERFVTLRVMLERTWQRKSVQAQRQDDRIFAQRNLDILSKLSYDAVVSFMQEILSQNNRKRLAVFVEGKDCVPATDEQLLALRYQAVRIQ